MGKVVWFGIIRFKQLSRQVEVLARVVLRSSEVVASNRYCVELAWLDAAGGDIWVKPSYLYGDIDARHFEYLAIHAALEQLPEVPSIRQDVAQVAYRNKQLTSDATPS